MAKRSKKGKAVPGDDPEVSPWAMAAVPLLLAAVAFVVYWPSLKSGFVYDARYEILQEGFITSLSNLPAVLSLKVLGMHLVLGPRPGQLLYLMLNAAVWGRDPFGYHLSGNLLHAANVALLFMLLRRLIAAEMKILSRDNTRKVQLAAAAVTLIFALHPVQVESVAEVSYSSSLLVMFFTLAALLAATAFRPENFRCALRAGSVGTLCSFAAVTCKESGIATSLLLVVYWFLYRRDEPRAPWFCFLGAALAVTLAFLAARFLCAPPSRDHLGYLNDSFFQVFLIQPGLWVFMMGKLLWPVRLSADYTLPDISAPPVPLALAILLVVLLLQFWLACRSRMGALGVVIYWLGLATVSNFFPLYRPVADRFYYLSMAGVALQLMALLTMLKLRREFWLALVPLLIATAPLTVLTVVREKVFADDFSLWSDTLRVSPSSVVAYTNMGNLLFLGGQADEAMVQYQKALKIDPNFVDANTGLGNVLFLKGRLDEAIVQYQKVLKFDPNHVQIYNNLGAVLLRKGRVDEAMIQFEKAMELNPNDVEVHYNLGRALLQKGRVDEAISQFEEALRLKPDFGPARDKLAEAKAGTLPGAIRK